MTKKLVSQHDTESTKKESNETKEEYNTLENSENTKEETNISNNNQKNEYVYYTPLKRIKLNIPMAPKKKRRNKDVNEYNIRGKNLLSLFQLVA